MVSFSFKLWALSSLIHADETQNVTPSLSWYAKVLDFILNLCFPFLFSVTDGINVWRLEISEEEVDNYVSASALRATEIRRV